MRRDGMGVRDRARGRFRRVEHGSYLQIKQYEWLAGCAGGRTREHVRRTHTETPASTAAAMLCSCAPGDAPSCADGAASERVLRSHPDCSSRARHRRRHLVSKVLGWLARTSRRRRRLALHTWAEPEACSSMSQLCAACASSSTCTYGAELRTLKSAYATAVARRCHRRSRGWSDSAHHVRHRLHAPPLPGAAAASSRRQLAPILAARARAPPRRFVR